MGQFGEVFADGTSEENGIKNALPDGSAFLVNS